MALATIVGIATPVAAAIQAATQMGHFGTTRAVAAAITAPPGLSHRRAGPLRDAVPLG